MRRRGSAFCRIYLAEMELIQDLAPSAVLSSCFLQGSRVKQAVKQLFFFVCCYLRVASVGLPSSSLHLSGCSPPKPLDIQFTTPCCSMSFAFSSVHFHVLSQLTIILSDPACLTSYTLLTGEILKSLKATCC